MPVRASAADSMALATLPKCPHCVRSGRRNMPCRSLPCEHHGSIQPGGLASSTESTIVTDSLGCGNMGRTRHFAMCSMSRDRISILSVLRLLSSTMITDSILAIVSRLGRGHSGRKMAKGPSISITSLVIWPSISSRICSSSRYLHTRVQVESYFGRSCDGGSQLSAHWADAQRAVEASLGATWRH